MQVLYYYYTYWEDYELEELHPLMFLAEFSARSQEQILACLLLHFFPT